MIKVGLSYWLYMEALCVLLSHVEFYMTIRRAARIDIICSGEPAY
jgi:hypothetical protein